MTTMECREIFAQLSEYLDGELPPDVCEQISEHIEDCPPCVEFVESLKKTVGLCKGMAVESEAAPRPLPEDLKARLMAALQEGCR